MSIQKSMALKGAYIVMKAKLLKYEPQVKIKLDFPVITMLDPFLKLEYISTDEQDYITKNAKHLLQLMPALLTLSPCSQSEPFLTPFTTKSKKIVELIKCKRKRT